MHDVQTRVQPKAGTGTQGNIFTRDDTFFGVCEAIGQDFGFNANWLRAALGFGLIWNPLAMVGIYGALAVAVLASRLLSPRPRSTVAKTAAVAPAPAQTRPAGDNEDLALATAA